MMKRRGFLWRAAALPSLAAARGQTGRRPRILLRGSWQSVNIGDIGQRIPANFYLSCSSQA